MILTTLYSRYRNQIQYSTVKQKILINTVISFTKSNKCEYIDDYGTTAAVESNVDPVCEVVISTVHMKKQNYILDMLGIF